MKNNSVSNLSNAIAKYILQHDFRLCLVNEAAYENTVRKVTEMILNHKPIAFKINLGSYKRKTLPSGIYANWAEIFHFDFMMKISSGIKSLYEPGAVVHYELGDLMMADLADVTAEDVTAYAYSFKKLADLYKSAFGFANEVTLLSEIVSEPEYRLMVSQEVLRLKSQSSFNPKLPRYISGVERSKRNNPSKNYCFETILDSVLTHEAILNTERNLERKEFQELIVLIHRKNVVDQSGKITFIPYRSSYNSAVQFWVGEGVYVRREAKLIPMILSENQIKGYTKSSEIKNIFFPTDNPNLKTIPIYEER